MTPYGWSFAHLRRRRASAPRRLARILVCCLLGVAACKPAPDNAPSKTTRPLSQADEAQAELAVREAVVHLRKLGLAVPVVFRSARHLRLGSLLPLRRNQLPATAALSTLLAPIREKLRPHVEGCAPTGVCVVVVSELVPASGAAAALLPELSGLALGPNAFQACAGEQAALARALGWPNCRGPNVILLSARHLRQRDAAGRVALVLHEVGHALGLPHSVHRSSVMHVDAKMNQPPYTQKELAQAQQSAVSAAQKPELAD